MKKILLLTAILILLIFNNIAFSQSYKNIYFYTDENTKIAHFFVHGLDGSNEKAKVFSKILYSYPDIYFVYVASNGTGIAFLSKTSLLEKFNDEIKEQYKCDIEGVNYEQFSEEVFLDYYLQASYEIKIKENQKPFNMVKMGITDKNLLNYAIAKEIYNNQMGSEK